MTTYFGMCSSISGGAENSLDSIPVAILGDGDIEFVATGSALYVYKFNATSTVAENIPTRIRPDDYTTSGVWFLQTVSQAAGPVNVQVFTTPGSYTYNPTPGATLAIVEVVGGGGSGGGSDTGLGSSAGGGAGGYARDRVALAGVSSVSVTVGAGGGAVTGANNGYNGGTSSFGAYCSATGGVGGTTYANGGGNTPVSGGVGVGGVFNVGGGCGEINTTCAGGSSYFGGYRRRGAATSGAFGAGGAGATEASTTSAAGVNGIVIVTEY